MTSDFRALCKELTNELHGYASANPHHDSDELVARARAALAAEPEPVGPTDEELRQVLFDCGYHPGNNYLTTLARAVLARWGNQS